jgi:hypothetical protein
MWLKQVEIMQKKITCFRKLAFKHIQVKANFYKRLIHYALSKSFGCILLNFFTIKTQGCKYKGILVTSPPKILAKRPIGTGPVKPIKTKPIKTIDNWTCL